MDNLNNILNKKFDDFEAMPSVASYEQVRSKLELLQKKKRRRVFALLFLGVAGISALLLLTTQNTSQLQNDTTSIISSAPSTAATSLRSLPSKAISSPEVSPKTNTFKGQQTDKVAASPQAILPQKETAPDLTRETSPSNPGSDPSVQNNSLENPVSPGTPIPDPIKKEAEAPTKKDANEPAKLSEENELVSNEEIISLDPIIVDSFSSNESNDLGTYIPYDNREIEKNLLQLKVLEYRPVFFMGLSYQPTMINYKFSENTGNNIGTTGYSTGFSRDYIENRNANKAYTMQGIPGLKLGVILQKKLVIGTTLGYYKLKSKETSYIPNVDSTTTSTAPLKSFANGTQPTAYSAQAYEVNNNDHTNIFKYAYASLDLGWILKTRRHLTFTPGISIAYHKILKASYLLLDGKGYEYVENSTRLLNSAIYTMTFKTGISRAIGRRVDLQFNPLCVVSPSSVFAKNYFVSQKLFGFGLEGALIYRFR